MKEPTKEELEQARIFRGHVIKHNGHVAYQMFTGRRLQKEIKITGISAPIFEAKPIFVGFIDPDLMAIMASNDMDNPDGSKAPEPLMTVQLPVLKKKPTLKRIK